MNSIILKNSTDKKAPHTWAPEGHLRNSDVKHDFEYLRNSFQIQARPATGIKTKTADQQSTPMKSGACSQVDPLTSESGKAENGPASLLEHAHELVGAWTTTLVSWEKKVNKKILRRQAWK